MKEETENSPLSQQELATCHCIIGHPGKAKFLAIRHQAGWTVPTLIFPPGSVDFRPTMITEGMQVKYGLNTRVLRLLVRSARYYCIELELSRGGGGKKLDAVWVDREQYQKFRSERNVPSDPFDQWLQEKEQGTVPALRSAWQIPGWFKQADHWIHFQAEKLGLQVTGSVQQFRVGWNASCLLHVPTSEGKLFFKAAYSKPPGEATLTPFLADRWPQYVVRPLAVDRDGIWLLTRDMNEGGKVSPDLSLLPQFARMLATMQIESIACADQLKVLGCPVHDLHYLLKWMEHTDDLLNFLRTGPDHLSEAEVDQMIPALSVFANSCRQLLEFGIPAALVHNDFRDANLVVQGENLRIFDWSDAVIAHPFMVLEYINSTRASFHSEQAAHTPEDPVGAAIVREINAAYLEGFLTFASAEKLDQAWAIARSLFPLWNLFRVHEQLDWTEKNTPGYEVLATQLKHNARKLISASQQLTSPTG